MNQACGVAGRFRLAAEPPPSVRLCLRHGRLPDGGANQVPDAVGNAQPQRTADYEP
jgi:hypothetical protein